MIGNNQSKHIYILRRLQVSQRYFKLEKYCPGVGHFRGQCCWKP